MKSGIDFILIPDKMGAINLNNMIPARRNFLSVIKTKFAEGDTEQDKKYKHLIFSQIEWCNKEENKSMILRNAKKLHKLIVGGTASERLKARCCDFAKMEQRMMDYS